MENASKDDARLDSGGGTNFSYGRGNNATNGSHQTIRFFNQPDLADWLKTDADAQLIGLIAHEYGYTPEEVSALSAFQFKFLTEWLGWYYKKIGRIKR